MLSSAMRFLLFCFRVYCATSPRFGANRNEIVTIKIETSTIRGPVGRSGAKDDIPVPATPDRSPNRDAKIAIAPSRSVHCRAAAAGAMSIALISTTPTD